MLALLLQAALIAPPAIVPPIIRVYRDAHHFEGVADCPAGYEVDQAPLTHTRSLEALEKAFRAMVCRPETANQSALRRSELLELQRQGVMLSPDTAPHSLMIHAEAPRRSQR